MTESGTPHCGKRVGVLVSDGEVRISCESAIQRGASVHTAWWNAHGTAGRLCWIDRSVQRAMSPGHPPGLAMLYHHWPDDLYISVAAAFDGCGVSEPVAFTVMSPLPAVETRTPAVMFWRVDNHLYPRWMR